MFRRLNLNQGEDLCSSAFFRNHSPAANSTRSGSSERNDSNSTWPLTITAATNRWSPSFVNRVSSISATLRSTRLGGCGTTTRKRSVTRPQSSASPPRPRWRASIFWSDIRRMLRCLRWSCHRADQSPMARRSRSLSSATAADTAVEIARIQDGKSSDRGWIMPSSTRSTRAACGDPSASSTGPSKSLTNQWGCPRRRRLSKFLSPVMSGSYRGRVSRPDRTSCMPS